MVVVVVAMEASISQCSSRHSNLHSSGSRVVVVVVVVVVVLVAPADVAVLVGKRRGREGGVCLSVSGFSHCS